jgi:hypothetical protein
MNAKEAKEKSALNLEAKTLSNFTRVMEQIVAAVENGGNLVEYQFDEFEEITGDSRTYMLNTIKDNLKGLGYSVFITQNESIRVRW